MKKFLATAAILTLSATGLAACNDTDDELDGDTTVVTTDTNDDDLDDEVEELEEELEDDDHK
ncbi:hypothetical protein CPHO_09965 [Corynebacterium phocae]|uniref:Lipoprotein n=2 Tax=Corynebacterium phocae TaxID=161895 RepID=A0A1L7D4U1_9CORY|nr:hypothetical protein [Corynebacterium phocae]APT93159.1 hypothetical protein CPHO_09965 [Corynebacterium phocae]